MIDFDNTISYSLIPAIVVFVVHRQIDQLMSPVNILILWVRIVYLNFYINDDLHHIVFYQILVYYCVDGFVVVVVSLLILEITMQNVDIIYIY